MKKIPADGVKRQHAYFDEEYKREALRLWRESGRSAAKVGEQKRGHVLILDKTACLW